MSIVLEKCSACDGSGWETFSFTDTPFHGGRCPAGIARGRVRSR